MASIPKIDINPNDWEIVRHILQKHIPQLEVWAFGSRAKWTAKQYSDLDLAIITKKPLPLSVSAALADDFSESDLPWKVDIVDWATLNDSFKKIIEKDKVVLKKHLPILADIVDFNPNRPIKKGALSPFIDMAALSVNNRDVESIGIKAFTGSGSKFQNGDTLFSRITPCLENGKTAKVSGLPENHTGHGSTEFIVMAAKEPEYDEDYIYYLARLPEFRQYAQARMEGTSGRQRVSWQALAEFQYSFPEKETRRKAASILRRLDDKIRLNTQTNQTLEQIAQALFKSWFVDFDPVKAKMAVLEQGGSAEAAELAAMGVISGKSHRELAAMRQAQPEDYQQLAATAALFPGAMQDSELGEIPQGWEVVMLSSMIQLIGGGTPKRSEPNYWNGEIPWVSVKDIPADKGIWILNTEEKITEIGLQNSSAKILPVGTTIISARGTVGRLAIVGEEMAMNQSCYGVIGRNNIGNYFNYFNLKNSLDFLKRRTHGAVFETITQATFDIVSVAEPPVDFIYLFEESISKNLEIMRKNLINNNTLSNIRDTLLPKLLSGSLTLPDEAV